MVLRNIWKHTYEYMYIPVSYTAYWLLARIPPLLAIDHLQDSTMLDPSIFHCANMLLHLVNACLVYTVLLLLVRSRIPSLLASLIFLLHPLQVESV